MYTLTGEVFNILHDEEFFNESLIHTGNVDSFDQIRKYMTRFFNEAISICDTMIEDNNNDFLFYSEAIDFKGFFSNLWEKIKSIVKKIYDWLKDVVKIIGKFIFSPFGAVFKSSKSKDEGNGGGATTTSSSKSKDSKDGGTEEGGAKPAVASGSIPGILEVFSGDNSLDMQTIPNNGGYNQLFDIAGLYKEIVSLGKSCTLGNNVDDTKLLKESGLDIASIKEQYDGLLSNLDQMASTFFKKLLTVNASNRGTLKASIIEQNIASIFEGAGDAAMGGLSDVLGSALASAETKSSSAVIKSIMNSKADICTSSSYAASESGRVVSMLGRKRTMLMGILSTDGTSIQDNALKLIAGIKKAYEGDTEKASTDKVAELTTLENTIKGSPDLKSVQGAIEKIGSIILEDQTTYTADKVSSINKKGKEKTVEVTTGKGVGVGVNREGKNKMGVISTEGETRTFSIDKADLYGVIDYKVGIRTIPVGQYISALCKDGAAMPEGMDKFTNIITGLSNTSKAISTFTNDVSKVKDEVNKSIEGTTVDTGVATKVTNTGAAGGTGTGTGAGTEAGNPTDKPAASDSPEVVQQYRATIVDLVKKSLGSLKDDMTDFINQLKDIEKHNRVGWLSVIQLSYLKDIIQLQVYLLAENMLYRRVKDLETANQKTKKEDEGKKVKDSVKETDKQLKKIDGTTNESGLRAKLYAKLEGMGVVNK